MHRPTVGSYGGAVSNERGRVLGGWAVSYERGTPASPVSTSLESQAALLSRPVHSVVYRGTSLTRKRTPLAPYRRPMPRVLGGS